MKLSVYKRLKKTIDSYAKDSDIKKLRYVYLLLLVKLKHCNDSLYMSFSTKDNARNSCNVLFLEIISEIIFAAASSSTVNEPPEDELVTELIETVTSTQQLSPFSDSKADKIPLVRSHLLQLLLDYEYAVYSCLFILFTWLAAWCDNYKYNYYV